MVDGDEKKSHLTMDPEAVDLIWSDDSVVVESPSSTSFLVPNCSTSGKVFLPLAVQPMLTIDPYLRDVAQRALYSSEVACSLLGGLSKHEAAAIWMLLHTAKWQHTYQILQNSLIKNAKDDLDPFLPYLTLLNGALQRLPKFRGNLWYYCDKDIHQMYHPGTVFNWSGFLRCKVQNEIILDESNSHTMKTIFCIQTSSGRIVVPFLNFCHQNVPVVISPNTFFQVILLSKLRRNIFLVGVKEIHSPYALEPKDSSPDHDVQRSSQQYWDKLLQNMNPATSSSIFLSVQNVAFVTANVPLYCSLLQRLSEIASFQCSNEDKTLVFSTNLKEMKRLSCYIAVQLFGCSVLNTLYSDNDFITSQVDDTEVQTVVLDVMLRHKESKCMTQTGLKLLLTLAASSTEFDQPQKVVDVVVGRMKQHSEENDIQTVGCSLLDCLSKKSDCMSFITEHQGKEVILKAIQVHRSNKVMAETCWRILLRLVRHNNNNEHTEKSKQNTNADTFIEVLKDVLKAYSKTPSILAEGFIALREALENSTTQMSVDTSYLELLITTLRNHSSSKVIVDCSFDLLVELTKSSELTKFLMDHEALTCILSAMKQHFNVANIQENGCKILRNITQNGCRGYLKYWDIRYAGCSPISDSHLNLVDFRLKVVESGGLDVIISAMKTHSNHIGTQREGCLTIRSLCVNAVNVVECRGPEDVGVVLSTFSTIPDSEVLQSAALRTLAILTIHPLNRQFMILNCGVEYTLRALRAFPACLKILEAGVVTLGNLSQDTYGALAILQNKGLQLVLMLMDSDMDSEPIHTSGCTVLAYLCSLPLHALKADDQLPTDLMFENGGYHHVADLMNRFPENLQLQKESCRVMCTLPRDVATCSTETKDAIIISVFQSAQNLSEDVKLLSIRCRAVGRVITFFDLYDTTIPAEIVDLVVLMIQQFPKERDLIVECCLTLSIITTNGGNILRAIFEKGGVTCMLNCLKEYQTDRQIMVLCLKIMNSIFPNQLPRTIWEILNPFQTTLRELTRQQILSVGGMATLLNILRNNFEDSSILLLVAPLFLISFSTEARVTNNELLTKINTLLTDIRNYYYEEQSSIILFCDELSHLVNL